MEERDVLKRLIINDSLFNMIHIVSQKYDILPDNKEHIGAYIEYQDIAELRNEFVEELADSIVEWIYSSEKYINLLMIAEKRAKQRERLPKKWAEEQNKNLEGHVEMKIY